MPIRILLIDDNLPDRIRYRRMLQRTPGEYEVVEAEDGHSGLAALDGRFAAVLLDQDLPDLQGLDVLDDIRKRANAPPVVMLTGEEDAAVSIEALRRGASDYLMKRRIDDDRLMRAVNGAIEKARLATQLREQQQRLARFYRMASHTEDALFIIEADTLSISDCNEAARTWLRLPAGDASASATPAAFASAGAWREFCGKAQREGSARYEWQTARPSGEEVVIELLARAIEEEGRPYIVAVGRDISLRKKQERELLERSLRDGLTGLWNRRAFDDRLADNWAAALRHRRPLSVILMDVDHFKLYNDTLGHPAGDDCLRRVAQALSSGVLRSGSMVARYGGEEFVALLEETDPAAAQAAAERLRQTVLSLALPHPRSSTGSIVSVSVGVASLTPDSETRASALVESADAALYKAKQAGRNRVHA